MITLLGGVSQFAAPEVHTILYLTDVLLSTTVEIATLDLLITQSQVVAKVFLLLKGHTRSYVFGQTCSLTTCGDVKHIAFSWETSSDMCSTCINLHQPLLLHHVLHPNIFDKLLHDFDVGLLMRVCYPKRSSSPLSNFFSLTTNLEVSF